MKIIIYLFIVLTGFAALAAPYDGQVTVCSKPGLEVRLVGKNQIFSGRTLSIAQNGKPLLKESYSVEEFEYNEHSAESSLQVPKEYSDIQRVAGQIRPKSVSSEMDWQFRVSANAIIYQTYSPLNPKFGGETSALVVELIRTKQFFVFDMSKDCKINGKSVVW